MNLLFNIIAGIIASAAFSILFQTRGINILIAALNGGIGYLVYLLLDFFGLFYAILFASMAIMIYAEIFARVRKAPVTIFLVPALIPIVPGGDLYNGMTNLVAGLPGNSISLLYSAFYKTAAIALGIILVSSVVSRITRKSKS